MSRYSCLHCLNEECCEVKLDKKDRPYTSCGMCGTRAFLRSSMAMRGLRYAAPGLVEMWKNPAHARTRLQAIDEEVAQLGQSMLTPSYKVG